ncbi:MAG TPA: cation:proton antiporter, partial [Myxococcales bacterium]|nr:cation:proton antiporter [Myxococcales bacterium]
MTALLPPFWLIRVAVASVWLYEGLWCKLLGREARQLQVVEAVPRLGPKVGALFLKALGAVEVAIAVWALSGVLPLPCAVAQTALLVTLIDATALVLYRIAVAAAVTGVFVPSAAALQFLIIALGGAAIGLGLGVVILRLRRLTQRSDVADTTLSLLTPFAAYLAAEAVRCSGVIAVV